MAVAPTISTVKEVKLDVKLRRKLITKLDEYFVKKAAIRKLEADADTIKGELDAIRDEVGEATLAIEGHGTITLVAPVRRKFNPKKFVSAGGDLAIYNQSFDDVLSKPYTKVSAPGEVVDTE